MHSPLHPGQILEELYIKPHNLTITEVAGTLNLALVPLMYPDKILSIVIDHCPASTVVSD